jgi:hypothetical protein
MVAVWSNACCHDAEFGVALLHRDGPIHVLESDAHAELRAAFTALAERRTSPSESELATLRGQVEGLVDAYEG